MLGSNLCLRGPYRYERAHPKCERDHSSSVARAIEYLFVGRWPEGPVGLKRGAMTPVGPLYFVARRANAWIMAFYILATSFVTFVYWAYTKVTNDVAQRTITIIQGVYAGA